jgi:transposase-like protein
MKVSTRRKRHSAEQIVTRLREAEALLASGQSLAAVCQKFGVSEQTYYRWRTEYGGMKADGVKRLKMLEDENRRLKKAVADLTLDKQILKEANEFLGNG